MLQSICGIKKYRWLLPSLLKWLVSRQTSKRESIWFRTRNRSPRQTQWPHQSALQAARATSSFKRIHIPMTKILFSCSTPSIFDSSWFTTVSWTPVLPAMLPRCLQMASISSKIMMWTPLFAPSWGWTTSSTSLSWALSSFSFHIHYRISSLSITLIKVGKYYYPHIADGSWGWAQKCAVFKAAWWIYGRSDFQTMAFLGVCSTNWTKQNFVWNWNLSTLIVIYQIYPLPQICTNPHPAQ